jgi:predicted nucleic-acid-binding Zn-ribbon protein
MGVIHKAYYQCDGCGAEFQDSDQVRMFGGSVKNGEGNKIFIQNNKMYCLNCLQYALDYENKVPETVEILNNQELEKLVEPKEKPITMSDLENKFMEINTQYLKNLTDQQKQINELSESIKSTGKIISRKEAIKISNKILEQAESERMENDILAEEAKKAVQIMKNQDEFLEEGGIEKFDDINSLEPEIPNEQINLETEQDKISIEELTGINPEYLKDSGKYLVLCRILTLAAEEYFAKELCKLESAEELKEAIGNKPLTGTYFSTNKYLDVGSIDNFRPIKAKVVNKILFGIPNIVDLEILDANDFAIIEKEKFEVQLEPIPKYKVPEESNLKPPVKVEKPQPTTIVKQQVFKDPIKDIITKSPKKKISDLSISGDDYV